MPRKRSEVATGEQKDVALKLPRLHPGQIKISSEAKRFNVACMGRRWGKSFFCRDRLIHPMLKGYPTAWFAPTNKILADSWREMKTALSPITVSRSEDEHRIEIVGGGSVEMWSLEIQDAARSRKYKIIVIDEAAMVAKLKTFWEENIRPTLTDYQGTAWFVSTPRGMNFFKTLFDRGQDPMRPDWMSWQLPTYTNPFIPADEVESARLDMTEAAFNQEYLALFVNWEGSVFRNITECATAEDSYQPRPDQEVVIGVDWGRSRDYTVFTAVDKKTRTVLEIDRSNKVDYALQRGRLQALRDKWKPVEIVAEYNSIGQPNIEQLEKDGVKVRPFITTHATKNLIIEHLALAFERMSIKIPNDPILLGELSAFQGEQLPSGIIRYSAAGDNHDDCVMSLAMAWSEVANEMTLGLVEFMREEMDNRYAAKVARSDETPRCLECGSVAVVKIYGKTKCNQCGVMYGDVETAKPFNRDNVAKVNYGRSR